MEGKERTPSRAAQRVFPDTCIGFPIVRVFHPFFFLCVAPPAPLSPTQDRAKGQDGPDPLPGGQGHHGRWHDLHHTPQADDAQVYRG